MRVGVAIPAVSGMAAGGRSVVVGFRTNFKKSSSRSEKRCFALSSRPPTSRFLGRAARPEHQSSASTRDMNFTCHGRA